MHMLSHRALLTCRYWAFGPGCPDISARNVQTCRYAHWDTGKLADFYEQRGTCYEWFHKRSCPFIAGCSYEHRDTGVMGLNQGMLVLDGLNLQIADAANRAGFNTRNHAALMDLIWSVRRIAFHHGVETPTIPRPPKHPIYPDRYRPSNGTDRTQTLGKRGRVLGKPRKGTGTADNPIDLDDEEWETIGDGTAAKRPAKRSKMVDGHFNPHKVELPLRPKRRNTTVHSSKMSTISNRHESRHRTASRTTCRPCSRSPHVLSSRSPSVRPLVNEPRALFATPHETTISKLRKIGNALKGNVDAVVECTNEMKALYDRDDRLGIEVIYKELECLNDVFQNCFRDATAGITTVKNVIGFLEDSKDRV